MERIRKISETYPVFKQIERSTGGKIKGEHSFIALGAVLFLVLFYRCVASPLTNLFALLLVISPATQVIMSKSVPDMNNLKHIVSYLLTFTLFIVVDSFIPFAHKKVPFYYHGKFLFFYYLSVRKTQFTEYISNNVYIPVHEAIRKMNEIDTGKTIKAAQTAATEKIKDLSETLKDSATKEE
ncbi:receptor expression-enhancing protein 5/6 [Nematocida sp. AWRm80]|nr:receptor expression-enhancing protein 5/6 [Nematocida sp. AWRm80]